MRGLDAGLLRELVEPGARGPARALGVHRLDHAGRRGGDERRLVGLDLGEMRGHDGDPLLHDRDVAAQEEAEAAEALLALGELGEARGRRERPEGAGDDPPAGGDEILVVEVEELRVVVGVERPPLRPRSGQGDERRDPAPHPPAPWRARAARPRGRGRRARTRSRGAARPRPERPPGARSRGTRWTSAPRPRWRGGATRRRAARAAGRWPRRRPRPRGRRARRGGVERLPRGAGELGRRRVRAHGRQSSWRGAASLPPTAFGLWPRTAHHTDAAGRVQTGGRGCISSRR